MFWTRILSLFITEWKSIQGCLVAELLCLKSVTYKHDYHYHPHPAVDLLTKSDAVFGAERVERRVQWQKVESQVSLQWHSSHPRATIWRKVALRAVSMNEIMQEDTGLWKKSSLLQHFRGGPWGRKAEQEGLPQEVGRRRIRTVSQVTRGFTAKEDIKIMPDTSREDKYNKKQLVDYIGYSQVDVKLRSGSFSGMMRRRLLRGSEVHVGWWTELVRTTVTAVS